MSAIVFTYKGRKPAPFGHVDTWGWSAPDAIVNVGGLDVHATDVRAVRTQETACGYCEPIAGMIRDEVTFATSASVEFHSALRRDEGVLAIGDTRSGLRILDVVSTGGCDKPTVTHVTLVGRIYESGKTA